MFHEVNLLPNVSEKKLHWKQEGAGSQAEYFTFAG